jgi:hypothetical protein
LKLGNHEMRKMFVFFQHLWGAFRGLVFYSWVLKYPQLARTRTHILHGANRGEGEGVLQGQEQLKVCLGVSDLVSGVSNVRGGVFEHAANVEARQQWPPLPGDDC